MDAAYIQVPFIIKDIWGKGGIVKIKATFDGHPYRGTIARMDKNSPYHILIVIQAVRAVIGKKANDIVEVVLQKDFEERIVEVPEDFQQKLNSQPKAKAFYESLSVSNRKEYIQYIISAKKAETRINRMNKVIDRLLLGKKNLTN